MMFYHLLHQVTLRKKLHVEFAFGLKPFCNWFRDHREFARKLLLVHFDLCTLLSWQFYQIQLAKASDNPVILFGA